MPVLGWALRDHRHGPGRALVVRGIRSADARGLRDARRARPRRHRLPRGHAHARPRHVADARQDRCRPAGAGRRHPAHPDGPVGLPGGPAPLRQAQALAAAPAGAGRSSATRSTSADVPRRTSASPPRSSNAHRRAHGRHRAAARRSCAASPRPRSAGTRPITARRRRVALSRRGDAARPRVAVIGAGSWGTTFGKILADGGAHVTMWARRPELANEIHEAKRNSEYLPGHQPPARDVRHPPPLRGARGRRAGVPVDPQPGGAAEPQGRAPAGRRARDAPIVSLMKGVERRTGLRMSQVIEQELHCDPVAHRRGLRPQPRPRDRARAADGRRHLVDEPGDGGCRRPPRPQPVLPHVREHRRDRHRVRRRAQEPHRRRDRHRRRRRLRREHQGVDHHARSGRDDRLRRRATARTPRPCRGSRASATSSRRASRRSAATTPPGGCSARATASRTSSSR